MGANRGIEILDKRRRGGLFETESKIGSSTRVHMHGDAPEPCPLPRILLRVVEKYVLSDIL